MTCKAGTSDYYTEAEIMAVKKRGCFFDISVPGDAMSLLKGFGDAGIIRAKLAVIHEDADESTLCVIHSSLC